MGIISNGGAGSLLLMKLLARDEAVVGLKPSEGETTTKLGTSLIVISIMLLCLGCQHRREAPKVGPPNTVGLASFSSRHRTRCL